MELYRNGFDGIRASEAFKERLCAELAEKSARRPAETPRRSGGLPRARKLLLAGLAAALLLLSACTAYALYWSSAQRAKEYAGSPAAENDLAALAQREADEIVSGSSFYAPIAGTATVDGLTVTLRSASLDTFSGPTVHLFFDAEDAKTGDASRLSSLACTLTVDGKVYPAYAKDEDGRGYALTCVADAGIGANAAHEIWFPGLTGEVTEKTDMTLTAVLYADTADARGAVLGTFTLAFSYEPPTEAREAERARLVKEILERLEAESAQTAEILSRQPDEATELNLVQGGFTLLDVAATEDGLLAGTVSESGWRDERGVNTPYHVYLDGYHTLAGDALSTIRDEHKEMGRLREDYDYPATVTKLQLFPWYDAPENLPETVLVAFLMDGESKRISIGNTDPVRLLGEEIYTTYTTQDLEVLLRVNRRTGEVTLPKDDAERKAWRAETERLAADGRNEDRHADVSARQTAGAVTVSLETVRIQAMTRTLYADFRIDGLYYPWEANMHEVDVWIDGVPQPTESADALKQQYGFSREHAEEWQRSYGGRKQHSDASILASCDLPVHPDVLPDSFTLRVKFDLYDRDENWEQVFLGTIDLTCTVSDFESGMGHD